MPGRRPVTVVRRVRRREGLAWARDDRGNAVYDTVRETVPNCIVRYTGTAETQDEQRDQVSAAAEITVGAWPGGPLDSVEFDGLTWSVQGRPLRVVHPRLGHVVVQVREVSG